MASDHRKDETARHRTKMREVFAKLRQLNAAGEIDSVVIMATIGGENRRGAHGCVGYGSATLMLREIGRMIDQIGVRMRQGTTRSDESGTYFDFAPYYDLSEPLDPKRPEIKHFRLISRPDEAD